MISGRRSAHLREAGRVAKGISSVLVTPRSIEVGAFQIRAGIIDGVIRDGHTLRIVHLNDIVPIDVQVISVAIFGCRERIEEDIAGNDRPAVANQRYVATGDGVEVVRSEERRVGKEC